MAKFYSAVFKIIYSFLITILQNISRWVDNSHSSSLKHSSTNSDASLSLCLHLQHWSDNHGLLVVVQVIHHMFSMLKALSKCLRHRVVNPILRKKVLKENHSKKQPSGSHEARNLQGTCLASWVASPFPLFASLTSPCLQTLLQGSPWRRWQCEWSPHPFRSVYWRAKI